MKFLRFPEFLKNPKYNRVRFLLLLLLLFIVLFSMNLSADLSKYTSHIVNISPFRSSFFNSNDTVKVACLVLSSLSQWDKNAKAIRHTWGTRCHVLLVFYSKFPNYENHNISKTAGTVPLDYPDGRSHLTAKTDAMLEYAHKILGDAVDWFFKIDDDTFVIWEHVLEFVTHYDSSEIRFFGRKDDAKLSKYDGTGYLVSKAAISLMGGNGSSCFKDNLRNFSTEWEEVSVGECLGEIGVYSKGFIERWILPSRAYHDEVKRNASIKLVDRYPNADKTGVDFGVVWMKHNNKYSLETLSLHNLNHGQIFMYEFMLYHLERPNRKKNNKINKKVDKVVTKQ